MMRFGLLTIGVGVELMLQRCADMDKYIVRDASSCVVDRPTLAGRTSGVIVPQAALCILRCKSMKYNLLK